MFSGISGKRMNRLRLFSCEVLSDHAQLWHKMIVQESFEHVDRTSAHRRLK